MAAPNFSYPYKQLVHIVANGINVITKNLFVGFWTDGVTEIAAYGELWYPTTMVNGVL